jgi:hypothetical protein
MRKQMAKVLHLLSGDNVFVWLGWNFIWGLLFFKKSKYHFHKRIEKGVGSKPP